MIDENSHHSQTTTEVIARTICFLSENVHPSKVFSTSTGVNSSFSSQEPRRPRFSFFYLHNVKELTIPPSPVSIVIESIALSISSEHIFLAGHPADQPARFRNTNSGRSKPSASLAWRHL